MYPVSEKFITVLEEDTNYKIIKKLSEGDYNLVLLALSEKDNKHYVLIVDKNSECTPDARRSRGTRLIAEMQKQKLLDNTIVQVYDYFAVKNVKLSDHLDYCPSTDISYVLVRVEEYIDGITLDEKIFKMCMESSNTKVVFFLQLKRKMEDLLDYIKSKGLMCFDYQTTNFMLRDEDDINSLTFVSINSFLERSEVMEMTKFTEEQLDLKIKFNLVRDMYDGILSPLSEEEINIVKYSRIKKGSAKLFYSNEIGMAMGMIVTEYVPGLGF